MYLFSFKVRVSSLTIEPVPDLCVPLGAFSGLLGILLPRDYISWLGLTISCSIDFESM